MSRMSKIDQILEAVKGNTGISGKEEKKSCPVMWAVVILAVVAALAAVGYALYKYFTPDEFEDDFEEDFEEDFFDDEEPEQIVIPKQEEEPAEQEEEPEAQEE